MPNKNIAFFCALAWTVLVTVLSLVTLGNVGGSIALPYKDKMVHFVFYFVFVLLWYRFGITKGAGQKAGIITFLIAVGYGLLMEACQSLFTTTRMADIYDAMANTIGAFAGLLLIHSGFSNKTRL